MGTRRHLAAVLLVLALMAGPLMAGSLVVTEVNYHPAVWPGSPPSSYFEFVEFCNAGTTTISLANATFHADDPQTAFAFGPQSSIHSLGPGEYMVVVGSLLVFNNWYNHFTPGIKVAGEYQGGLGNKSDTIFWTDEAGVAHHFTYQDSGAWPSRADGGGSSIELMGPLSDYTSAGNWHSSHRFGGTPGRAREVPDFSVLLNEVRLDGLSGTVELYNAGTQAMDVGGWYISDDATNLFRYAVPQGSTIKPGDFLALSNVGFPYQYDGTRARKLWLISANTPLGWVADYTGLPQVSDGVSVGRWPDPAAAEWYPLQASTFGSSNAPPAFGPVVISEIEYRPATTQQVGEVEFVEIYNPTTSDVSLAGWRFGDGVLYNFHAGQVLHPYHALAVLPFDPQDSANAARWQRFQAMYTIEPGAGIVGGYTGQLSSAGEGVQLDRAGTPPPGYSGLPTYWAEDRVVYDSLPPWPQFSSDVNFSLQRKSSRLFGSLPESWISAVPSPGVSDMDDDGDGMPDRWEILHFGSLAVSAGRPTDDQDHDGIPDIDEYFAGTDPNNPDSKLAVSGVEYHADVRRVVVKWSSVTNHFYGIKSEGSVTGTGWANMLMQIPATPPENAATVTVTSISTQKFYRVFAE